MLSGICSAQQPSIPEPIRQNKDYDEMLPPTILGIFKGKMYLAAMHPSLGYELFSYDGLHKPKLVKDIVLGETNGLNYTQYQNTAVYNGCLYFAGNTRFSGFQLMRMNSKEEIEPLKSNNEVAVAFGMPEYITSLGDKIYYGDEDKDLIHGLFVYNPALQSASRIKDSSPVNESSFPQSLCVYQGKLIFKASTNADGVQLYAYNPASKTTEMLSKAYSKNLEFGPDNLLVTGDKLYFTATTEEFGRELFSYDGKRLDRCTDVNSGGGNGVEYFSPLYKGEIYFAGDDGLSSYQLYTYNPATKIAALKFALNPEGNSMVKQFTLYKGLLYFAANPSNNLIELWVTDGNATHKVSFAESSIDAGLTDIGSMQVWNEKLYFTTSDEEYNFKLWEFETKEDGENSCKVIIKNEKL